MSELFIAVLSVFYAGQLMESFARRPDPIRGCRRFVLKNRSDRPEIMDVQGTQTRGR
jgi:hypothetical protein